ncbi:MULTISPECIES: extracellular solute-binding protein [Flavobacteriaceae]|uniref:sn-glycerol-3-phosphate-binding periplasmic protein UgpB n=1 Tax=Snuella sedimenti TaxID=2798802 RepID=A0A8J7J3G6_9FLAO|nr:MULTISPECIES: ABC transporter substrate-binding protein [Flavobacteriaceae]MBJ6367703.1 carbohydrate ABC transporter substrate-binding protein [Snuella sedimenti]
MDTNKNNISLKGIAWNHTRGFTSVVATAQRFEELNPNMRITWEKRSLQAFADASLDELTNNYDLLIMDNPHVSIAARDNNLLAFNDYLNAEFIEELANNSVGKSHASYNVNGKQWTLATDAATPIATWREDLIHQQNIQIPNTWEDLLTLTKTGKVAFASIPIDTLMHHYMLCEALGASVFTSKIVVAPREIMIDAIKMYKKLVDLAPSYCLEMNPIHIAELMTSTDEIVYSPFNYGYSNYSKKNYADKVLKAGSLVTLNGKRLRSVLGGAGIAVSSKTKHAKVAMQYAEFNATEKIQSGLYFDFGGQPGHRKSWLNEEVNKQSKNFFKDTLQTLDKAIMRPQYYGYMYFQDNASPVIHEAVSGKVSIEAAVDKMNALYAESLKL